MINSAIYLTITLPLYLNCINRLGVEASLEKRHLQGDWQTRDETPTVKQTFSASSDQLLYL